MAHPNGAISSDRRGSASAPALVPFSVPEFAELGSSTANPNPSVDPITHPRMGSPVTFLTGQFAGRTIRAELRELQKANVGRKFLRKDRRPLDPPPTCTLTFWDIQDPGTPEQREKLIEDYESVQAEGWLCHAEMFTATTSPPSPTTLTSAIQPQLPGGSAPDSRTPDHDEPTEETHRTLPAEEPSLPLVHSDVPQTTLLGQNVTTELSGSTFTHAIKPQLDNHKAITFVFTDLSSKMEGTFVLRYRCFNVLATAVGSEPRPVVAECVGGPFIVYSTRSFPGLGTSTSFTKSLSTIGIHTNKRESVRKGGVKRKDPGANDPAP